MTATLSAVAPACTHTTRACERETAAFKAQAKRKDAKPAGYTWPLWHQPRQPDRYEPETIAEVVRRQLAYKPKGYVWTLWHRRAA